MFWLYPAFFSKAVEWYAIPLGIVIRRLDHFEQGDNFIFLINFFWREGT